VASRRGIIYAVSDSITAVNPTISTVGRYIDVGIISFFFKNSITITLIKFFLLNYHTARDMDISLNLSHQGKLGCIFHQKLNF
jgi:hypothetical protein